MGEVCAEGDEMMNNILAIEGQIMYDAIKDIDTPKEALTKLAGLKPSMGWDVHPERVRAVTYAMWLKEKGFDDMFAYFEKMIQFLGMINSGGVVNIAGLGDIPDAPEGWIVPTPYLKGKIPKEKTIAETKPITCDSCEKTITDDVTECPHCGARFCVGCELFVDEREWGKESEEYCNDCLVSAAEARRDAMYDMG